MAAVIETHEVSKWFGEVVALNNLSVVIEEGVTGLLGPNGAGKSTFIKLALGLYRASRGYIRVLGESPRNNRGILRRIGYCPETDKFYENMTGYEFVYWLNRFWGMSVKEARRASEAACDIVHMTERMHDPIDEYSKGMRQRIKIAQSLSTNPKLLFLDEPMSGLDPQGREEMYALIHQLGQTGYSVIVSSHILYEIERVTDSVVLLYNGTMLAQGRVRQIRDLIDEHPHTITVESNNPRAIAQHFVQDTGTMIVEFDDGRLTIRTRDPNLCYQRLNDLMVDQAVQVGSIQCSDDNLQSVFDYLTR
ncbi:MAG TPA: ABC transporter ATP-binding protein [Candidatus Hydrogenedentes bacterium]|mgnify:CR=1 FL=1|nr:ABC transporter ATP-binding protein [Candidatus Hydrogenedentota bacterium]